MRIALKKLDAKLPPPANTEIPITTAMASPIADPASWVVVRIPPAIR